jgi:hypothetical protein
MNQQMLSLEAAQSSFAKISQLNLFNYIKWFSSSYLPIDRLLR